MAQLVDGVTKIGKLQFTSKEEQQAENFRKMIVAMSRDIRSFFVNIYVYIYIYMYIYICIYIYVYIYISAK